MPYPPLINCPYLPNIFTIVSISAAKIPDSKPTSSLADHPNPSTHNDTIATIASIFCLTNNCTLTSFIYHHWFSLHISLSFNLLFLPFTYLVSHYLSRHPWPVGHLLPLWAYHIHPFLLSEQWCESIPFFCLHIRSLYAAFLDNAPIGLHHVAQFPSLSPVQRLCTLSPVVPRLQVDKSKRIHDVLFLIYYLTCPPYEFHRKTRDFDPIPSHGLPSIFFSRCHTF